MRRGKFAILILAALAASPAVAAPASQTQPGARAEPDPAAAIETELVAFGAWINRANAIQQRSQGLVMGLGPAVQQINASGAPAGERMARIRTALQQALSAADASAAEFEALDTPAFPGIDLPDELRPAALKQRMLELTRSQRSLIADLLRALDTSVADPAAFRSAVEGLFRSITAIYDSQILLARATMESAPRDSSERAIHSFEVALLRGMYRLFRAYSPFEPAIDRTLSADLAALAGEIDGQIRSGEVFLTAELAEVESELADGDVEGSEAALLRRAIAAISISRDYFEPARRLSAHFRALSQSLRGQILTEATLASVVAPLRQFRVDMDAVAMRQNQIIAATP
jgi:hypothetical protein